MKKRVVFSFVLALFLVIPMLVKADVYTDYFDELFKNDTYNVNADVEINDYNTWIDVINLSLPYNYYENDDYQGNSSSIFITGTSFDYDNKTVSFQLGRIVCTNYNCESTSIKDYANISINIVDNFNNDNFPFVKNNKIEINYDETMFTSDEEKNNYVNNYFWRLNTNDNGNKKEYFYDKEKNRIICTVTNNGDLFGFKQIKKIDGYYFNYVETAFSEDFKKLTSGNLTIKSDGEINVELLNQ